MMDSTDELMGDLDHLKNYYLVALEIVNFKSYKGKHLVGPLTELTAIIGPNGSGKSNLMDAISFALVIKTDKLRAKNVTKLINNSSLDSGSPAQAYVKLIFKSKTNHSLASVMRTIVHNSSRYFVNDTSKTKTEYTDFLLKLGFNARNKIFLIFQGTIDTLITKNTTDFTAILEEISGSSQYKDEYDRLKNLCYEKEKKLHVLFTKKQSYIKSRQFVTFLNKQHQQNVTLLVEIEEIKVKIVLIDLKLANVEIENLQKQLKENVESVEQLKLKVTDSETRKQLLLEEISRIESEKCNSERLYRESEVNIICRSRLKLQTSKDNLAKIETRLACAVKNEARIKNQISSSTELSENLTREIAKSKQHIRDIKNKIDRNSAEIRITNEDTGEYNRLKKQFQLKIRSDDEGHLQKEKHLKDLQLRLKLEQIKKVGLQNELAFLQTGTELSQMNEEIDNLSGELSKLRLEKKDLEKLLQDIRSEGDRMNAKLSEYSEETKKLFISSKRMEIIEREKEFMSYLTQNYPGVYGRLSEVCKPANKKYQVAISRVMQKYLNAIVVDSYKTVDDCFKNESAQFLNSETFLALDKIKAPVIKNHLRNICAVPNVHLMYDLIRISDPKIEKAVRFVVGNTLICQNKREASKVAYELGDGNRYNAISLDGTYFQANGLISASFSSKSSLKSSWDYCNYIEQVSERKSIQNSLFEKRKKQSELEQSLDKIEVKIQSLELRLKVSVELKEKSEKVRRENELKCNDISDQIERVDQVLCDLEREIQTEEELLSEHQAKVVDAEREIFGDFLRRLDFASLKQFETVYFNIVEDDLNYLCECETRLKEMENRLKAEQDKNLAETLQKWNRIIEEESEKLDAAKSDYESCLKLFEADQTRHAELKASLDSIGDQWRNEQNQVKVIEKELSNWRKRIQNLQKSIVNFESTLRSLFERRHDLYRNSFIEALALPFISDPNSFQEIFNKLGPINEVYSLEDGILLDYTSLAQLIDETDSEAFITAKQELESLLQRKEDEIQKLTLSHTPVTNKKNDLLKSIRVVSGDIDKGRTELNEIKGQFDEVKRARFELFSQFLERISTNLDRFYKELMQSDSSQAFLLAENVEEPYLGGVMFNCIVPGKIFQPISCLSGGEKSLAAFAFIFSSYFDRFPTFFVMDEIDGCLDNTNIAKLIRFLKTKTEQTQFILISLKSELYGQADSLVGVCKNKIDSESFQSKTLTLDLCKYQD